MWLQQLMCINCKNLTVAKPECGLLLAHSYQCDGNLRAVILQKKRVFKKTRVKKHQFSKQKSSVPRHCKIEARLQPGPKNTGDCNILCSVFATTDVLQLQKKRTVANQSVVDCKIMSSV
jgi:hypothetical protein